jgi:hypothetical protein
VKGVPHYKRDGTEHKGTSHKMPNGDLHTNKSHTKTSVKLFHLKDLSKKAQQKLKVNNGNNIFRVNKRSP